jgi:hypothetical protein
MKKLYVGLDKDIELPPQKDGYLLIDKEVKKWNAPQPIIFDYKKHHFNPLQDIDKKKAREIARLLYTASPQGENTLTVRNGRRALAMSLAKSESFDKLKFDRDVTKEARLEVNGMVDDLLFTDVMRKVLCNRTNFSFNPRAVILAPISRAELGDEDALMLGLLLMSHYRGQLVIPDFGFYGRDMHVSLIEENRLIAGVNTLNELPPKLRQGVLSIEDKVAKHTTFEDAETLANYSGFPSVAKGYKDFVQEAME